MKIPKWAWLVAAWYLFGRGSAQAAPPPITMTPPAGKEGSPSER